VIFDEKDHQKIIMVVPVSITSCPASEYQITGPVIPQTMINGNAVIKCGFAASKIRDSQENVVAITFNI